MWAELAQSVFVHLREGETAVTGKAATAHALRQKDVRGAELGQGNHILVNPHLTRRASEVKGDMLVRRMEIQTVHKVGHDKLGRLVELEPCSSLLTLGRADASIALLSLTHHLAHTVQTGALGTEYRIFAFFRSLPEGCLQFGALTVGNVEHAFRLPNLAAAHLLHAFGENDLVAGLCHQLDNLIDECVLDGSLL